MSLIMQETPVGTRHRMRYFRASRLIDSLRRWAAGVRCRYEIAGEFGIVALQ